MNSKNLISLLLVTLLFYSQTFAQKLVLSTRGSQRASITQRIGTTDVTIVYHSPLVKGRKVFGKMVPYDFSVDGKEYPWRAGSNENTTIKFTHEVTIEGKTLPAGTYGLHLLVSKKHWTFIFSKDYKEWGSFKYKKSNDALRVKVKTQKAAHQEWLGYNFVDRQATSAGVELWWAKTKARFNIRVNVSKNIIGDVNSKEKKDWKDYLRLAQHTYKLNPANANKALEYADKSIAMKAHFANKILKAKILRENGKSNEAQMLKKEALAMAKGFSLYFYGMKLFGQDKKKEAFEVFSYDLKHNASHWASQLGMAEYYIKTGDKEKALKYLKKASEIVPDGGKGYAIYRYLSEKVSK